MYDQLLTRSSCACSSQELKVDAVKNPSNLLFGQDGALYVACFTLDHIVRFELQQQQQTNTNDALSASYKIFARELDGPSALAVDTTSSSGGLFVASFGGDEVLRLSATGRLLQRYGNEDEVDCPEGVVSSNDWQ